MVTSKWPLHTYKCTYEEWVTTLPTRSLDDRDGIKDLEDIQDSSVLTAAAAYLRYVQPSRIYSDVYVLDTTEGHPQWWRVPRTDDEVSGAPEPMRSSHPYQEDTRTLRERMVQQVPEWGRLCDKIVQDGTSVHDYCTIDLRVHPFGIPPRLTLAGIVWLLLETNVIHAATEYYPEEGTEILIDSGNLICALSETSVTHHKPTDELYLLVPDLMEITVTLREGVLLEEFMPRV